MSSSFALRVAGVSKAYQIQRQVGSNDTLRDEIAAAAWRLFRRRRSRGSGDRPGDGLRQKTFWAVDDVSFDVPKGQVLGIIGRNGAGKSTLLKLLSRITEPTSGRIELNGRIASLLEVGTGFHPELTGRENVYLNGSVLGMTRKEINRKFDEIVAFADIEDFLDTPVKRYSSGMYVRLAFAVAAHLEPEILIIDEVLAVGDAQFQKKSLDRMRRVAEDGRTVLLVSHQMEMIHKLCHRVVRLDAGRVVDVGTPDDVIARHLANGVGELVPGTPLPLDGVFRRGSGDARFVSVSCSTDDGTWPHTNGPLRIRMGIRSAAPLRVDSLATTIYHRSGLKLVNSDSLSKDLVFSLHAGLNEFVIRIDRLALNPGRYVLGLWLARTPGTTIDWVESAGEFEVVGSPGEVLGPRPDGDGSVSNTFSVEQHS